MEIDFDFNEKTIEVIAKGEAFIYDNTLFMRVYALDSFNNPRNCVNLKTGIHSYFPPDTKVLPVDVKIVEKAQCNCSMS